MANVQLVSDTHLECGGIKELINSWVVTSDTLLMAGDIVPVIMIKKRTTQSKLIKEFFEFVSKNYKNVFWVCGNHEFWGNYIEHTSKNAQDRMKDLKLNNIHVLNNTTFKTPEFVIFGATLWASINKRNPMDMMFCSSRMNDYSQIKKVDEWLEHRYLQIEDTVMLHENTAEKLKIFIDAEYDVPKIVMTHHAPSRLSLSDYYKNDQLSAAYASDLYDMIYDSDLKVWVHGHIHEDVNYMINKTRICSNTRGYWGYESSAYSYSHISIDL